MADEERPKSSDTTGNGVLPDAPTMATPMGTPGGTPPPKTASRFSFPVEIGIYDREAFKGWERYEVGSLLGEGGMGQVFRAFDPRLRRPVALKVLRVPDPELLKRFLLEAQNQARVDHPNVCKVYEVGDVGGQPYIAMQFVDGQSLDLAARSLTLEQRVLLMRQVAEAVHAAHQLGLIHRDIKPSNILVEATKEEGLAPFVTDFGIAREASAPHLTATGTVTGTPQYMSPEQARGVAVLDRRTDVYSLGATLYELLAGAPPFSGDTAVDVLIHVLDQDAPRLKSVAPSVPADLETIVMKCLDKDPSRRYDSAKALADDLQRFLAGDPIQARPASLAYRLAKKARKNRLLTAVSAVSLLAILTLLGLWGATRARSAERARLSQRFGQETERATAALRYAYMMPLHDTRPELRKVEETLRDIDREAGRLGGAARGAGDYAVGRALVALQRPREARVRLERAWSAGYREPEVAYALGQALGMIYREEAEQARRVANKDMQDARLASLDKELREPALMYLRQSAGASLEAPAYARGLIALYARDYDAALRSAGEAQREVPWLYEAHLLAGDALFQRAQELQYKGQYEPSATALDECGKEFGEAALLARSAPEVYVNQASLWVTALELKVSQGKPAEEELRQVLAASDKALEADPGNADALNRRARAYWRLAEHYLRTGGDPVPPLREAMAASGRILEAHPDDAQAHFHMGSALNRMAEVQASRGEDPEASYRGAIEHLEKSLAAEREHPFMLNNLGLAHWRRGQYHLGLGKDPTQDLDKAADYFRRASSVLLAPILLLNRGNVYTTKAMYLQDKGQDSSEALKSAVQAYEGALKLNPKEAVTWSNLASAQFLLAERLREGGGDPAPVLKQAEESCLRSTELNPKYASAFNNLSNIYQLAGDDLANSRGLDPLPAYAKAREAMARARAIKPDSFRYVRGAAEVEQRCAAYAIRSGANTAPFLDRALPDARQACAMNPKSPDVWSTLAECHLLRARALKSAGKPSDAEVAEGLKAADSGLALNAEYPTTVAHKAFLLALLAEAEKDVARRAQTLKAAGEACAKAGTLHPDAATRLELKECEAEIAKAGGEKDRK